MVWTAGGPQGNEAAKIKYEIVQYTRGRGLDLGCGPYKLYPHFIGVDNGHHWGISGVDVVSNCEDLDIFADAKMDFVFSSHLMEHIEDFGAALKEWWRVIKPGGHLVLYLPHKDYYPNCGEEGANPDHKHDFKPRDIISAMRDGGGWDLLVSEERNQHLEYSFLQVFQKREDGEQNHFWSKDKPKKTCCVVRFGGFGDMLQASSVLPLLKKQGYHITFMTTPLGHDILRTNPYIDAFFIQDKDQVPNDELIDFWWVQAQKFDKFINFSEAIECTLLPPPTRIGHSWPESVRKKTLNVNYMEWMHELAEVPHKFDLSFYPTKEEYIWARDNKPATPYILFPVNGSAVHKRWPHMDQFIARVMLNYPHTVVLVGNEISKLLEQGWEKEPRVWCKSGDWSIRQTLTMATLADVVMGPETGVLNAVANCDNKKLVFLSHSSEENLTKHWTNTTALTPDNCPCYPCHLLHYGSEYCDWMEDKDAARCAWNIGPEKAWQAFVEMMR